VTPENRGIVALHGRAYVPAEILLPYFQAEAFYDTRYDGWARPLYQVGAEVQLTEHFRVEPYLARQLDDLPPDFGLYALGFVLRWYY
jgi:hypothetical protein